VRRWARRHPSWGAAAVAATAWVLLLSPRGPFGHAVHASQVTTSAATGLVPAGHPGPGGHVVVLGGPFALPPVLARDLPLWALMCVAMMVPAAMPAVRHVALNSVRWRRQRAVATFLVAYLGVWWGFGLLVLPLLRLLDDRVEPWHATVAAGLLSAGWLVSPALIRCRRACHRTVPLPLRGRAAVEGCLRFGLVHGFACVGVCGPLMLVMATVLHASAAWMVVLTALVLANKLLPRRLRPGAVRLSAVAARKPRPIGVS